jgi:PPOX class probable F420-dependent enzyme
MDLNEAREFLRAHHRSVLATTRADGRPQMSPVVHAVNDEGRLLISSREPAYKVRNVRRDPRVSLLAISDGFFGEWVQADGTAEIVSLPGAMELLVDYYRRVSGEHPDWDDYRRAMAADRRCIILVSVERAGPDRSG